MYYLPVPCIQTSVCASSLLLHETQWKWEGDDEYGAMFSIVVIQNLETGITAQKFLQWYDSQVEAALIDSSQHL